jgi:2-polyprenyl-3-methyl-5-hydroxy-6-metoxy-1,4-benzoquinol methylase
MKKLSENEYWNTLYASQKPNNQTDGPRSSGNGVKRFIRRILGERTIRIMQSYNGYLLKERFYPECLPTQKGLKAVEIGSAPGYSMISIHRLLGYDVYGIEYTEKGAELNRQLFAANNINPDNVFHVDFLSEEFHAKYAGFFDVVFSEGFIEHFDDVEHIIDLHLNLLTPGGTLFVRIPRFRGMNYLLMSFFHRENLDIHNLKIMERENFRKLFKRENLDVQYCDYLGTFNLNLFNTKPTSFKRYILRTCVYFQYLLNGLFWLILRKRGLESRLFSPYLLFIGKKKK